MVEINPSITSVGKEGCGKLKFSYIPSGNVNWCSCLGKQSGSLKKLNTEGPYDPAIPILDICSTEIKSCLLKNLYTNVHSNTIHSCQKMETRQISYTSKWINKMWCYPHWSITQTLEETKVLVRDKTCRNPENIILNERSQTHTATIP